MYFNDPLTYEQRGIQSGIVDVLGTTCSCKSIQRTRHCSPVGPLLSTTNYPDHLYRLHLSRGAAPSKGRDEARQAITNRKRIIVFLRKRNDVGKSAKHKITEYTIDRSSNSPRRNRNPRKNHERTTKLRSSFSSLSPVLLDHPAFPSRLTRSLWQVVEKSVVRVPA